MNTKDEYKTECRESRARRKRKFFPFIPKGGGFKSDKRETQKKNICGVFLARSIVASRQCLFQWAYFAAVVMLGFWSAV